MSRSIEAEQGHDQGWICSWECSSYPGPVWAFPHLTGGDGDCSFTDVIDASCTSWSCLPRCPFMFHAEKKDTGVTNRLNCKYQKPHIYMLLPLLPMHTRSSLAKIIASCGFSGMPWSHSHSSTHSGICPEEPETVQKPTFHWRVISCIRVTWVSSLPLSFRRGELNVSTDYGRFFRPTLTKVNLVNTALSSLLLLTILSSSCPFGLINPTTFPVVSWM